MVYDGFRQFVGKLSGGFTVMNGPRYVALLIWGLSVLMVFSLFMVARYGQRLHKQNIYDRFTLRNHRKWVCISFWVTVVVIIVIEPTFRMLHLPYTPFFRFIHLPLFLLYALFFALAWIYDGRTKNFSPRFPRRHNKFGRWAQYSGLLTAVTGDWLVYTLIWLRHSSALH